MNSSALFHIQNIYVKYDKKYILENFSLDINKGDFYVVLGSNGCGKSTLIKSLVRVNKLSSGCILYNNKYIDLPYKTNIKIRINNTKIALKFNASKVQRLSKSIDKLVHDLNNPNLSDKHQKYQTKLAKLNESLNKTNEKIRLLNAILENDLFLLEHWEEHEHIHSKKLSLQIAYVPQLQDFPEQTTVYDFVKLGRYPHSNALGLNFDYLKEHEIIIDALNKVGIEPLHNKYLDELSGGQKQKALIALALAQQTDTIILDEPTNHLDIKSQLEIMDLLESLHSELNKNIIIIIHDINMGIKYATNICLMKEGRIIANGTKQEVITKQNIFYAFGVDVDIYKSDDNQIEITKFWLSDDEEKAIQDNVKQ